MLDKIASFLTCLLSGKKLKDRIKRLDEISKQFHLNDELLRNTLQELEDRDALIHAIVNTVPSMIWHKDTKGRYILVNEQIRMDLFYGFDEEDILGKTDIELALEFRGIVGEENHTFGELCEDSDSATYFNGEATQFYETGKIHGVFKRIIVHKDILRDATGKVVGTVGAGRDVTIDYEYLESITKITDDEKVKDLIFSYIERYKFKKNISMEISK